MGNIIKGNFIELVEEEDVVPWQYKDTLTGQVFDSIFKLRVVPNSLKRAWEKDHTDVTFNRRGRQEDFNWGPWVDRCLDYAIVSWEGIMSKGQPLPCTSENKLKLPEVVRAEIVRLCVGKELGEIIAHGPGGASTPQLGKDGAKEKSDPN